MNEKEMLARCQDRLTTLRRTYGEDADEDRLSIAREMLSYAQECDEELWEYGIKAKLTMVEHVQGFVAKHWNIGAWFYKDKACAKLKADIKNKREPGKEWTEEEKVWFNCKKEFEENLSEDPDRAKKFGAEMDEHFRQQSGMTIEAFIKENPSYKSFTDIAIYKTGGEAPRKKTKPEPTAIVKVDKDLIHTDRAFNLLKHSEMSVTSRLPTYKLKMVHDVLTESLWESLRKDGSTDKQKPLIDEDEEHLLLDTFLKLSNEDFPKVEFTDTDFRRITGKKWLSGEDIKTLMEEYSMMHCSATIPCLWNGKTYKKINYSGGFFSILSRESGAVSKNGGKPIYLYKLIWHLWGFLLLNTLIQHKFTLMDRGFHGLPGAQQHLVRYLKQFNTNTVTFKISTIIDVIGMKEDSIYKSIQKTRIIKHLDSLVQDGRIKSFAVIKGKTEPLFKIKLNQPLVHQIRKATDGYT